MAWLKAVFFDDQYVINYEDREKIGMLAGTMGILSNIGLTVLKLWMAWLSNSVSIMTDAINNLSDTASSIVVIIGFFLAKKPADSEHPYGHARYEYISGMFVALLVIFIGVEFFKVSLDRILHPSSIKMNMLLFVMLIFTILIKIGQSAMNYKIGRKINSIALMTTAKDSFSDVLITIMVLVSAMISYFTSWQIDGYVGCFIAGFILIAGGKSLLETIGELLGKIPNKKQINKIEKKLSAYQEVIGFHDLMVHSYGVNKIYATVHAEIDASENMMKAHDLIDQIENDFLEELNINLLIHIDPVVTDNDELLEIESKIEEIVKGIHESLSIHDVRISFNKTQPKIIFDLVMKDDMNDKKVKENIIEEIQQYYPESTIIIHVDYNYIELNIER